ncbi:hypothetical protein HUA74_06790 [Myxococcus sp. CA051A]|uniref:Uncharacterized protein n=1 Tax=Myxococcus llanfairpwllgwyngyllgogerychwyrndrobwllllantysiliogogogochensis TaxID=2590453 RepID=A0A540X9M0_9BACT|nr:MULTISPECIES: hypothetical protein [Myxococcus]NTX02667.1 hypothetical protein [Myxococcus sp. CA040A]NTX11089.1 hypothetical protein [Myxococcus sp. CA056]NTX34821.1 hypothetical protein [Myxococcus sp. CA033]NTX58212.1 hypothetical protein [Myxococcus sp. CA039A]NTX60362.1 hypothetical protein [Myxococcus sp. CA051A]
MIAPPSIHVVRARLLQLLFGLLLVLVALSLIPSTPATLTAEQTAGPHEDAAVLREPARLGTMGPERCPPDTLCLPSR